MDRKNKNIIISYADENMKYSLRQWGIQAHYLPCFDKVIKYTKKDLPTDILKNPLMQYKKGGGYWIWKPFLIWKTLQNYPDGTKVFYMDAGCSVHPGEEWNKLLDELEHYSTLLFQYAKNITTWVKYTPNGSSAIEHWTKKKTLDFFDDYLETTDYHQFSKIEAGYVFCKGKNNPFIKEWLDITINHPDLIIDPNSDELKNQYSNFCGLHRHDQSIITPIAYKYKDSNIVYISPDIFDENPISQIISSSRNHITKQLYMKTYFKYHLQGILGINMYNSLKKLILLL